MNASQQYVGQRTTTHIRLIAGGTTDFFGWRFERRVSVRGLHVLIAVGGGDAISSNFGFRACISRTDLTAIGQMDVEEQLIAGNNPFPAAADGTLYGAKTGFYIPVNREITLPSNVLTVAWAPSAQATIICGWD